MLSRVKSHLIEALPHGLDVEAPETGPIHIAGRLSHFDGQHRASELWAELYVLVVIGAEV